MAVKGILEAIARFIEKEHILSCKEDLICYSSDATYHNAMPDVVVIPEEKREIIQVLRFANSERIPVTPRGAGTGLSGGALPVRGGIVLATTRLNRIIDIDESNLYAVVEPGVITASLHSEVEQRGLFYPPDPSSLRVCTIGGNLGHSAGGPRGLKYGITRNYVMGLEVVLPQGKIINTGARTVKSVSGYDLTRLMTGSEGTLGVITKALLRLIPKPEASMTFMAFFDSISLAADAVVGIIKKGILPTSLEFMDGTTIKAIIQYKSIELPEDADAALLIEVDGFESEVKRQAALLMDVLHGSGARGIHSAKDKTEMEDMWNARRMALPALSRIRPSTILEDATVPRHQVPIMVRAIQGLSIKYDIPIGIFGHAGDGNLHPTILTDVHDKDEMEKVDKVIEEIFEIALSLGGTLTGEHGIGVSKARFLKKEIGEEGIRLMRAIRNIFDPNGIMNPGKIC